MKDQVVPPTHLYYLQLAQAPRCGKAQCMLTHILTKVQQM
jgi:hypothetical protein